MSAVAVIETDAVVASMSRARMALAEAKTIQETKRIVDAAAAAEIYARRQKLGEEASELALSIKVEALRKLGEMLQATPKSSGVKLAGRDSFGGTKTEPPNTDAPTLADLGLTKKESAVAQKLASLPEAEFQQVRDGHVTVAKAIAAVDAARSAPAVHEHDEYIPDDAEIADALAAEAETLALFRKAMEGDDPLSVALRENTRLQAENEGLRSRLDGLMNEKNEAVRLAKSLRRKLDAIEKAQA